MRTVFAEGGEVVAPVFVIPSQSVLHERLTDIDKSPQSVRDVHPWLLTHCDQPKVYMGLMNILDGAHHNYYLAGVRSGMHPQAACAAACALLPLWAEAMCEDEQIRREAFELLPKYRSQP